MRAYTPCHNDTVEHYNRILNEEVLYAGNYTSDAQRSAALQAWNVHYNHHHPTPPTETSHTHPNTRHERNDPKQLATGLTSQKQYPHRKRSCIEWVCDDTAIDDYSRLAAINISDTLYLGYFPCPGRNLGLASNWAYPRPSSNNQARANALADRPDCQRDKQRPQRPQGKKSH
ncbi:hypothetical protein [Cutibacterium equinum]|uniref:hypothetical protein n=1 Tax=Cutibacterium equinum TaxID=3016342 RepID=UPI0038CD9EAB